MIVRPGDIVGPYYIERPISSGGMSHVWLAALQERPHYKAALKFNASDNTEFQDLLRREAGILSRLRHPNIARIFPLRLDRRRVVYQARAKDVPHHPWYYAMEYVSGGSLVDHMPRLAQFPITWRMELLYQVFITILFIHRAGYAHCDLKPENILLRQKPRPDRLPHLVIVDFGSVSAIGQRERITLTPGYSPPELFRATAQLDDSSLRSPELLPPDKADIWAMGAIAYEMLTAMPLVTETDKTAAAQIVLSRAWKPLREAQPDINEPLELMVNMMLHPNPHSRPSMEELIEAVEERIASIAPPRIPDLAEIST